MGDLEAQPRAIHSAAPGDELDDALVDLLPSLVAYTLRHGLVHEQHRPATEPFASPVGLGFTFIFLLSVPVAFLSTTAAALLWAASILLHYPLGRMTPKAS